MNNYKEVAVFENSLSGRDSTYMLNFMKIFNAIGTCLLTRRMYKNGINRLYIPQDYKCNARYVVGNFRTLALQ